MCMSYPTVDYLVRQMRDYLRVVVTYGDDSYEIQYHRDSISREKAEERTSKYVRYARQEHDEAVASGSFPFDGYRANIRMFKPATLVDLPFEGKSYKLLFSLEARGQKHLRGIVRELHRKAYEKPPAPFR